MERFKNKAVNIENILVEPFKQKTGKAERVKVHADAFRIQKLGREFIDLLIFALGVIHLVADDYDIIERYAKAEHVEFVKKSLVGINFEITTLLGEYGAKRHDSSASGIERFYTNYVGETILFDEVSQVFDAVYVLYGYPKLRKLCEKYFSQLPKRDYDLVKAVQEIIEKVHSYMLQSPQEATDRELQLLLLYHARDELADQMRSCLKDLKIKVDKDEHKIQGGWDKVSQLEFKRNSFRKFLNETLDKHKCDAENQMIKDTKLVETKMEKMIADSNQSKIKNNCLNNLIGEKDWRAKKNKIELLFIALVEKNEAEIQDLDHMLYDLQRWMAMIETAGKEFEEEFDLLEDEYKNLMGEKLEYETRVFNEKMLDIQKRIAARKIQRFYRSYLAVMIAQGRKSKKGKKGKKK